MGMGPMIGYPAANNGDVTRHRRVRYGLALCLAVLLAPASGLRLLAQENPLNNVETKAPPAAPKSPEDSKPVIEGSEDVARKASLAGTTTGRMCQNHCAFAGPSRDYTMSSDLIQHTSDAAFDSDVLQADKPVLVDYWAEWCGPCKMIAPILDEVSKDYDGRLKIAKMNVDENRDVPAKFGIRGIPTLMLFKGGALAATKVGALSKAQLTAFIDSHL